MLVYLTKIGDSISVSDSVELAKKNLLEIYPKATFDTCGCPISIYNDGSYEEIGYISAYYVHSTSTWLTVDQWTEWASKLWGGSVVKGWRTSLEKYLKDA